jgi:hypothetical protein
MRTSIFLVSALSAFCRLDASGSPAFQLHGQGWAESGQIVHATDTLVINLNGNRLQSMGAQFTAQVELSERLEAGIGFGTQQVFHSLGNQETERNTLSTFKNFITEARLTYSVGDASAPFLNVTVGNFAYNYHPQVKNLGLYLFRGPVYPGFLVSGFKDFHTDTTRAAFSGARVHNRFGNFEQDLILNQEHEVSPTYDWSLGYVAKYKAFEAVEFGVGANFYHWLSENEGITTPSRDKSPTLFRDDLATMNSGSSYHPYELQFIEVMPGGDTVFYTHKGIKLMGMFHLDLKPLFGLQSMGDHDLELYGEAGIIGLKNYGSVYKNRSERIPMMLGFNIPTFGLLNYLSIEVEYYGAKFRSDYSKIGAFNSLYVRGINPSSPNNPLSQPSPIPVSYKDFGIDSLGNWVNASGDTINVKGTGMDVQNMTTDDFKWSIYLEKTILGHLRFIGQVANDHTQPRPVRKSGNAEAAGFSEAFTTSKDWYFMARLGYFF